MLKDKIEYLLKHNLFVQKCYKIIVSSVFNFVGRFLKVEPNLVLINAFAGKRFGDSPKMIYDYLRSHEKYRHLRIVWAFDHPEKFDIGCEKVQIDTWSYFKMALKAKYWITCVNIERGLKFKKKQTRYLNTWHGVPLKFIGNDVEGRSDYDFSDIDVFCYSGEFEHEIYKRAFRLNDDCMLKSGMPRNDELYNVQDERIAEIRKTLGIPEGKKIILYAPTWRESTNAGKEYVISPPIDLKKWEDALGDEYILFFRAHHFTTKLMGVKFNDFVWDMSNYPNINELMIVSDILVSDYSATIFDYAILERPIISFAYDFEMYKKSRGLYLDLPQDLPNGIYTSEEDVLGAINGMDYKAQCLATKVFKEKYIEVGGDATRMCVEKLFES